MSDGDSLQRILTLYVLLWIENKISGGKFEAHLDKGIEEDSKEGIPSCPWPFPFAVTPASVFFLRQEKQNNGIWEEEGAGRGAGWFMAKSGLAPSPLLGPLGLLGIHNPVLLPIWGI